MTDRRSGADRRAEPRETPERRRPGRPPTGRTPTITRRVKLSEALYDAICRIALRDRVSIHAVLVRAAIREVHLAGISGGLKNTDPAIPS